MVELETHIDFEVCWSVFLYSHIPRKDLQIYKKAHNIKTTVYKPLRFDIIIILNIPRMQAQRHTYASNEI